MTVSCISGNSSLHINNNRTMDSSTLSLPVNSPNSSGSHTPHHLRLNNHLNYNPSETAALLWKNLSVYQPSRGCRISDELREEKRILKSINGAIHYQSLNAIMGPSGSGKTTLLRCLFGTSSIKYTGSIFVGDKNSRAVFITQNEEDHLLLNLTVEESIRFASKIKNNSSCRLVKRKGALDSDIVSSLIDQLDLERCRHTLVGKCSGGQKKRLAIAQELASNIKPKIIFMDEPTSG
jgi:ABC-type multidrug transport system ATPase subunit